MLQGTSDAPTQSQEPERLLPAQKEEPIVLELIEFIADVEMATETTH